MSTALFDDSDLLKQRMKVDGPADADALRREQPLVFRIPDAFAEVFPIPIDRHSEERSLIIVLAHEEPPS